MNDRRDPKLGTPRLACDCCGTEAVDGKPACNCAKVDIWFGNLILLGWLVALVVYLFACAVAILIRHVS